MKRFLTKASTVILSVTLVATIQTSAQTTVGFQSKITGLSSPLDVVTAGDGTGRIYVVQQAGVIRVYSSAYALLNSNFLTVSPINSGGEEGLLSLAFHPNYASNGFLFVYYTNNSGNLELARYQNDDPTDNSVNAATKQVVLTISHPGQSNHNGGKLWFGSDGYLYFATGDGGGANDPDNSAQTGNNLLGKMLRIDVGTGVTASYSIPATNPYLTGTGDPGGTIMDEIFSLGLRNPFRWSFDNAGNMWIGDVGQGAWEEVSRVTNGSAVNFGWRCFEGTVANSAVPGCMITIGTHTPPIYQYPNPGAFQAAVTGGLVYEGTDHPSLQGWYYAADFYSGDIHKINTTTLTSSVQTNVLTQISGFGETEDGEILVVTLNGTLQQLLPASALPVKLEYFNGRKQDRNVLLEWKTVMEMNASHFEVEYSTDGSVYRSVGTVPATNDPNGSLYSFNHLQLMADRNAFYRLKMIDIDRSFEYSSVIHLVLKSGSSFVQPSIITTAIIDVYLNEAVDQLRLLNMQGAVLKKVNLKGRTGLVQVSVAGMPKGVYAVQLISGENITTQKIIID